MSKPIIGIGSDLNLTPGKRDRAFVYTTYTEALRRAGAIPVMIPPQPENAAELANRLDGLLFAGGDDCDPALDGQERETDEPVMDPRRQSNDFSLVKAAHEAGIPTLGICLGMQMLNIAAGGTLLQDIATQHETEIEHTSIPEDRARHDVHIEDGARVAQILGAGEINVNSSHHQAVRNLGSGLRHSRLPLR